LLLRLGLAGGGFVARLFGLQQERLGLERLGLAAGGLSTSSSVGSRPAARGDKSATTISSTASIVAIQPASLLIALPQ